MYVWKKYKLYHDAQCGPIFFFFELSEYVNRICFTYKIIFDISRGFSMAHGSVTKDDRANTLANVTKTIGNLLDGYDIRLRPNFGGKQMFSYIVLL